MDSLVKQKAAGFRKQSGLALVSLVALIAVLIVGPLCFAAYEVVEYNFCQLQLKHCVDSAALAAGCGLTESTSSSISLNEQYAMNQALFMFQQNTILGHTLANATSSYATGSSNTVPNIPLTGNQSALYFRFVDPYTGNQVGFGGASSTNALNTAGKIIRVTGLYGFVPQFYGFVGLKNSYTVTATSDAGLPQLDLVFCFDTSNSMDDFTQVALVNRYGYSGTTGKFDTTAAVGKRWDKPGPNSNTTSTYYNGYTCVGIGQLNSLFNATADSSGCSVNAGPPQGQDTYMTINSTAPQPNWNGHGATYDTVPPCTQGDTPNTASFPTNTFTDLVIPLDGNSCTNAVTISLGGMSMFGGGSTYTFPTGMQGLAVLVEAQRGNLSPGANTTSGIYVYSNLALGSGTSDGVSLVSATNFFGWFNAYFSASMSVMDQQNPLNASLNTPIQLLTIEYYSSLPSAGGVNPLPLRHPLGDCVAAVENFFQAVWNDADVHFGLVVYNDQVGKPTSSDGTQANPTICNGNDGYAGSAPVINNSVTGGNSDYTTPVTCLYSTLRTCSYTGTYEYAYPMPADRLLIPLPQLVLQKSPGSSLSSSLFDTTVPPALPTSWCSVNYCLYNYAGTPNGINPPSTNLVANSNWLPYCVEPSGAAGADTNWALAINTAVSQFASSGAGGGSRLGATPAIILFTDGVNNVTDSSGTPASAAAQPSRTAASLQKIPIFCVGLAANQASNFASNQLSTLQAITNVAGIGSASYQVAVSSGNATALQTSSSSAWNPLNSNNVSQQLDIAFQNVARQLVGLLN